MDDRSERLEQFAAEIDRLGLKAPGDATERPWQVAGTVLVVASFVVILVGWYGASGTTQTFEQLPYLISGGALGVALAALGGALVVRSSITRYMRFWFVRMVYEERVQTDRAVEVLERIEKHLADGDRRDPQA